MSKTVNENMIILELRLFLPILNFNVCILWL